MKACILSIDGGGIRGIIPGVILSYIEQQLQIKTNNPNARLADFFDLIAGTSTGGILTCCYLLPNNANSPISKYSAQETLNLYVNRGHKIFDVSFWQNLRSVYGLIHEKHSADELEKALYDYFGNTTIKDFIKPCIITAYDIFNRRTIFFNKQDALNNNVRNFYIKDVARATSAAPTYFEPACIRSLNDEPLYLIDGGMFANNPAMCAYVEAMKTDFKITSAKPEKPSNATVKDMLIVSIGTGTAKKSYSYKEAKDWGKVGWLRPIIDILMSGNAETVDYELCKIYSTLQSPDDMNYHRLEPSFAEAKHEMDDASLENIKALLDAGKSFVSQKQYELDEIVSKLIDNN